MTEVRPTIYLIGGAAGAGKTTVSAALAARLGIGWLQADSTWLALKAVTTGESHPALRFFPELSGSDIGFEAFDRRFIEGSGIVCAALEPVIRHELEGRPRGFVLEGTWLTTSWMAALGASVPEADVRSILLFEPEPAEVLDALIARSIRPQRSPSQVEVANWAWRIGLRLREEALDAGLPVVAARPRDSLLERVAKAFEIPPER